jgi:nitroreductase
MHLGLTADEVLTTTRAVRKRLDLERPVEREVLLECLEIATKAPSGSNSQQWHWVFVTDAEKKAALAELYRSVFRMAYSPERSADLPPEQQRVWGSANHLAEHFHEVPVMLVPCLAGRPDATSGMNQAGYWGSLLPAAWSFCLAARERGLGTAWTTMHLVHEQAAADILGIPFADYTQGGLFPVAYTKGTDFTPAARKPLDGIVHWDTW